MAHLAYKQPSQVVTLLQQVAPNDLLTADIELALFNACRRGHIDAVSHLLLKKPLRPERLNHAITISAQYERVVIVALLMICRAAMGGRVDLIRFLYGESDSAIANKLPEWYIREAHVSDIINSVRLFVPLSLALQRHHDKVCLVKLATLVLILCAMIMSKLTLNIMKTAIAICHQVHWLEQYEKALA